MDMQQLQYFLTSADKGSLTRAAEELYTTQPHVSQVIKALERDLGVSLFSRTPHGIALTEDGERIRVYAQNIMKNTALIREVSEDTASRRLRIAANPSSSLAFLTEDFFRSYMEQGLSLQYTECGTDQMINLLEERQYDLGLLFVPVSKLSALTRLAGRHHLTYQPLRITDLVLHAGTRSRYYGKPLLKPEELDGCTCIQLENDFFSVEDLLLDSALFRSGKCSVHKIVRTNSDHLMIRMLQQTELCNLGTYWLRGTYGKYDFSLSVIDGFQQQISFGYMHVDHRPLRPETEQFLHLVEKAIADEGVSLDAQKQ